MGQLSLLKSLACSATKQVKMLTIHRWFDIESARRDLGYEPVVGFEEGWAQTIEWFKAEWKPRFDPAMASNRK